MPAAAARVETQTRSWNARARVRGGRSSGPERLLLVGLWQADVFPNYPSQWAARVWELESEVHCRCKW